ncbi:MAG TPA: diaminopimelate decarboxylase [Rhodanobacteraceae bacterium]|nr:diaminopimelate decarboxylase [Rhodanobacteraceae bacterium]
MLASADADVTWCEGVDLLMLAERVGTPLHAYSANAIRARIRALKGAFDGLDVGICYAVKANANVAILHLMDDAGLGADIVSVGELQRCLRAGILPGRIVFSGVGKQQDEIDVALAAGVARFNVESFDELELIERVAARRQQIAIVAVRINPDVDALTHAKISTGKAENKFGVTLAEARRWFDSAAGRPHVQLDGLHVHIGSQLLDLAPLRQALRRVDAFRRELVAAGYLIRSIDVGGGLGVRYRDGEVPPTAQAYADVIRETLGDFDGRILLEPGRWLVAEAGVLLTRVIRVKHGESRCFLVLDAAMNDLARPALYDAWHDIEPVSNRDRAARVYDVVGPVCETGDTFAAAREMPECRAGELVMIRTTGAYGAAMASTYNARPLAAEVLLDQGRYAVIRRRQSLDEMMAGEHAADRWETP